MIGNAFRRLGFCKQKYGSSFQYKVCKWLGLDFNEYNVEESIETIEKTPSKKTKSSKKNTLSWRNHKIHLKLVAQANVLNPISFFETSLDIDLKMFEYRIQKVEDQTQFIEFQTSFCDVGFAHMGLGNEDYEHKKEDEIFLHLERPDRFSSTIEKIKGTNEKELLLNGVSITTNETLNSFNYAAFSYPKVNDIKIKRPFEISTATISRELFFEVMSNDAKFKHDWENVRNIQFDRLKNFLDFHIVNDKCKEPKYPISVNDWYLAIDFCNGLSRRCGLQPAYSKYPEKHIKCSVVLNKEGKKVAQIEKPLVYLKNRDTMNLSSTIEDIERSIRMQTKLKTSQRELNELKASIGSRNPTPDEIEEINELEQSIATYDLFVEDRKKTIEILKRFMDQDAYVRDDVGHIQYVVKPIDESNGFRLPMEVEWVYAAQANTNTRYSGSNNPKEVSWFGQLNPYAPRSFQVNTNQISSNGLPIYEEKNLGVYTKRDINFQDFYQSRLKKPNAWGIYDMSGNLWEWTQDFFNPILLQDVLNLKESKMEITSSVLQQKTSHNFLIKPTYDLTKDYDASEIQDKRKPIKPLNNANYIDKLSTLNRRDFGLDIDKKSKKKLNVNEITIKGGGNSGLTSSFAKTGLIGYRQRALKVNMFIPELFEQYKEYILALYYYAKQIWKSSRIKPSGEEDIFISKTGVANIGFINEIDDMLDLEYREAYFFDDINFATPLFVMILHGAIQKTAKYFELNDNGQLIEDLVMDKFSTNGAEDTEAYEQINIDNVAPLPINVNLTDTLDQVEGKIAPNVENMHIGIRLIRYLD